MNELEQVYLIASFPTVESLTQVARSLVVPEHHLVVLGSESSGAEQAASKLGLSTTLSEEVELDEGQDERLRWHLENTDRPLLAVQVAAEQGRELRHRLKEMGADMITDPTVSSQAGDVSYVPGIGSAEPNLPPDEDRIWAPN